MIFTLQSPSGSSPTLRVGSAARESVVAEARATNVAILLNRLVFMSVPLRGLLIASRCHPDNSGAHSVKHRASTGPLIG